MPRSGALGNSGRMRAALPVLGAAGAFGAVSVLAKLAYEEGAEPVPLLGARLAVATLVLALVAKPLHARLPRRELALCALAGLAFAGAGLGEFEALARAPAATVVLLLFVAPVWIALARRLVRGERLGLERATALAAMLSGLALLVAAPDARAADAVAVALALGASVMSAAFFLSLEHAGERVPAPRAACAGAASATAIVVPLDPSGAARELMRPETAGYALAIGALTGVALVLLTAGMRHASALVASAVICAEPVVVAALSWLLLGELLAPAQLAGAAVVLLSVTAFSALTGCAAPARDATGRTRRRRPGSRPPPRPARSARRPR
jgi:drug/metabolite transporter (DMT)-like permease